MTYYFIYIGIACALGLCYTFYMISTNKKQKANFLEEHPNAAKIFFTSKGSVVSEYITIHTVNDKAPVLFTKKLKPGFYAAPGVITISVSYVHSRPGVMYKSVTETLGPLELDLEVEPHKEYILSYDRKKEEFSFEEKILK